MSTRRFGARTAPAAAAVGALVLTGCGTGADDLTPEDVQRILIDDIDSTITHSDPTESGDDPILAANCTGEDDDTFTCEFLDHRWVDPENPSSEIWAVTEDITVHVEEDGDPVQLRLTPVADSFSSLGGIVDLDAETLGTALFDSPDDEQTVEVASDALETEDDESGEPLSTEQLEQAWTDYYEDSPTGFPGWGDYVYNQTDCSEELEPTVGSFVSCAVTTEDFDPAESSTHLPAMVYVGEAESPEDSIRITPSSFSPEEISQAESLPDILLESEHDYENLDVEPEDS